MGWSITRSSECFGRSPPPSSSASFSAPPPCKPPVRRRRSEWTWRSRRKTRRIPANGNCRRAALSTRIACGIWQQSGLGLNSGCATKSPAFFEQLLKAQPHAVRSGRGGSAGSDCNESINSARLRQDRPPLRFAALPREIARSGAVGISFESTRREDRSLCSISLAARATS